MAELLGSLLVRLGLESGGFRSGLDADAKKFRKVQKEFEKIGASMAAVGQKMTVGITLPLAALAAKSVEGAQAQAQAMAQVEAALTSMGDVSGKTADELAKTADALELNSLFAADEILTKVTANLLTFGNVAGDVFDRAQQSALDMAQRMGGDAQSAAIMLGKALNDPVKGITALTRVGVQFSESQKAQIAGFQATGQAAKAQSIILSEVERQFAGSAQAAADASPWRQAQVTIDQAMDKIGEAILPVIPVIADAVARMAEAFTNLSPGMQQAIIIGAALAAALGPLVGVFGSIVQAVAPLLARASLGGIASVLGPALPVVAALAAAGALIYANWDKIAPVLTKVWDAISSTLGPPLQKIVTTISTMLTELWNGPLGEWLRTVVSQLGTLAAAFFKTFGPVVLAVLKTAFEFIGDLFTTLLEVGRGIGALFSGDLGAAFEHFGKAINALFMGLPEKVIGWVSKLVNGVRTWLIDKLNAVWDWVIGKVEGVSKAFYNLYDAVVGHSYVPDMVDEIGVHMRRLDAELVAPATAATEKAADAFRQLQQTVQGILARLFPENAELINFEKEKAALDAYHKAGKLGAEEHAAAVEALRREYLGLSRDFAGVLAGGKPVEIELAGGGKTIEDMLEESGALIDEVFGKVGDKAAAAKVQVVESFKEMAEGVMGSISNLTNSIKSGGFLDILQSVIDLVLKLGSIGVFGKGFQTAVNAPGLQARAMGGPVTGGRPYLVGENGPELFTPRMSGAIIPNHRLGGSQTVQIEPSRYFDAVVDGRILRASPSIMEGSAKVATSQMKRRATRTLYGG